MKAKDFDRLVEELRTQNNQATACPLFCVQQKRRIYGIDPSYHDCKSIWTDGDEIEFETDEEFADHLAKEFTLDFEQAKIASKEAGPFLQFERVWYIEIWEFVCAHFTKKEADFYITQNRHNLSDPRVYVSSQYRCHEWIDVVDGIKEGSIKIS